MAEAAVRDEALGLVKRFLEGLGLVHRENGRELLVREFLRDVDRLDLADEDFGRLGHLHAGERGDGGRLLADDLGVERAVDDDGLADLLGLVLVQEIAAARGKLGFDLVVNLLVDDDRLLGSADHTIVKRLGVND